MPGDSSGGVTATINSSKMAASTAVCVAAAGFLSILAAVGAARMAGRRDSGLNSRMTGRGGPPERFGLGGTGRKDGASEAISGSVGFCGEGGWTGLAPMVAGGAAERFEAGVPV